MLENIKNCISNNPNIVIVITIILILVIIWLIIKNTSFKSFEEKRFKEKELIDLFNKNSNKSETDDKSEIKKNKNDIDEDIIKLISDINNK